MITDGFRDIFTLFQWGRGVSGPTSSTVYTLQRATGLSRSRGEIWRPALTEGNSNMLSLVSKIIARNRDVAMPPGLAHKELDRISKEEEDVHDIQRFSL